MILIVLLLVFVFVAVGAFVYGFRHGGSCIKRPPQSPIEEDTGEFTQEELDYWYQQQEEDD